MPRPVISEALEVLRSKCPDAPEGDFDPDLVGAWSGAMRGVPDEHVLEAAEAWQGGWPLLTEFLSTLGRPSSSSGPSPARQEQMRLTSAERKQRALDRIAQIRADLAARRQPEEAPC